MEKPYYSVKEFFINKFNEPVYKIAVDGGFTCPNRDGTKGVGGCSFCNERGAGEHTFNGDIIEQVKKGIAFAKTVKKANKYAVYFQSFSSTYKSIAELEKLYTTALSVDENIVALAVATRPDCIDEEKVQLLKSISSTKYVWCELGLQTSSDKTAKEFNRGYDSKEFTRAVELLNGAGIDVVVHLIVGLKGEGIEDIINTANFLKRHKISGVKIHSLFVVKGTRLYEEYLRGEYTPITREFYIEAVGEILSRLDKNIVVHRLTGDGEKSRLVAPIWTTEKKKNLNAINNYLLRINKNNKGE